MIIIMLILSKDDSSSWGPLISWWWIIDPYRFYLLYLYIITNHHDWSGASWRNTRWSCQRRTTFSSATNHTLRLSTSSAGHGDHDADCGDGDGDRDCGDDHDGGGDGIGGIRCYCEVSGGNNCYCYRDRRREISNFIWVNPPRLHCLWLSWFILSIKIKI